ncbi:hypothetical protein F5051DRAFT_404663 [Lentinula edodes]|nr:hypothetical protein F5051DRAFT_404663 [Lentinula edodes]
MYLLKCIFSFEILLLTQVNPHAPVHALRPSSSCLSFRNHIEVHLLHHQCATDFPLHRKIIISYSTFFNLLILCIMVWQHSGEVERVEQSETQLNYGLIR